MGVPLIQSRQQAMVNLSSTFSRWARIFIEHFTVQVGKDFIF